MLYSLRYWLTHPREALCDLGIRGCDLHIRTGWFPRWNRRDEPDDYDDEPMSR